MSETKMNIKLNSLQALRGIAAIMIIFEHVSFLRCGIFGVDIFFVLSGFMIVLSTEKGMDFFLIKRLIRIVPFYWLVTILTFLAIKVAPGAFASTQGGIKELLLSMFFIPFDMNTGSVFSVAQGIPVMQPLMRIGWTLNLEMLFYVVFYLSAKISYRARVLIASTILLVLVALSRFIDSYVMIIWGNAQLIEFIFGMLLYLCCKRLKEKELPKALSILAGVVLCLTCIVMALLERNGMGLGLFRILSFGLPAALVILCAYLYEKNLKTPAALVFIGDISFSIYYVHYYIIQAFNRLIFTENASRIANWLTLAVAIIITLIVSYIAYLLIEKKLTGVLRKVFVK